PLSNNAYTELFDLFYDLDRYSEAIELCDQRLGSTTDAGALYRRAMAQLGLGWYAQAHESLRLAQRESPGDATIAQLYRDVATELGRGETTAIAEPLDAVEPPAGLIRDDPTPPEDSGIGVIYDHRVKAIAFTPGEQLRTTEYIRARVLDRRGVDYLSTFRFTFDPTTERLFINSAIVRDAEKAVVWTGSLDDYYITSDASDAASQDRTANIPVAALAPGR